MTPIISLIIPCYNSEKYIKETLDCLQKQTIQNWECIICNDGSTDESLRIIREYEAKDCRYKIIYSDNNGPSTARNKAIAASSGKYILPLDSDDIIAPSYAEKAINHLEKHEKCKIVYCYGEHFGKLVGPIKIARYKTYKDFLMKNSLFNACVMRRDEVLAIGGYDEKMHGYEDWEMAIRLFNKDSEVHQIKEVLFYYRIENDNSVNADAQNKHYELCNYIYKKNIDIYLRYVGSPFEMMYQNMRMQKEVEFYAFWYHRLPIKIMRLFLKFIYKLTSYKYPEL